MTCVECRRDVVITLWRAVVIGKRTVVEHFCVGCARERGMVK